MAFVEATAPDVGVCAGYAVGRRVGTAVARNRVRRRLRAVVAARAPELPGGAYLVSAGPGAIALRPAELEVALTQAMQRATRRRRRHAPGGEAMRTTEPGTAALLERPARSELDRRGSRISRARGRSARAIVALIRTYQLARTGRPTGCRFTPSCSSYAIEAVERLGPWAGGRLALGRLVRCHPWGGSRFRSGA